jgi:benzoyl-CoA reductase subunit A
MDCFVGIDLGSTTTKAVFLDENERILGRGITNSRSNYKIACQVAQEEAEINARFLLLQDRIKKALGKSNLADELMAFLICKFALAQHKKQLKALQAECDTLLKRSEKLGANKGKFLTAFERIFVELDHIADSSFEPGGRARSDFFRDIATSLFLKQAESTAKDTGLSFDQMVGFFDKAILQVENHSFATHFAEYLEFAHREILKMQKFQKHSNDVSRAIQDLILLKFNVVASVGTGYGRMTLPFPKDQIRSEILCHGLGAHYMFPETRTVLDIGGQDTKAIQVDEKGIVTGFQMNDRCAAGCGRYLGYIADEMNMGVHQLGPMAMLSTKPIKINSTCTVFAGAELRERLALGERREDILAGLHRSIILRAMSLLARSGGLVSEFTFTGGVARNEAAVSVLKELVKENYGAIKMNISPDSIYTGALGASLFAKRDAVA